MPDREGQRRASRAPMSSAGEAVGDAPGEDAAGRGRARRAAPGASVRWRYSPSAPTTPKISSGDRERAAEGERRRACPRSCSGVAGERSETSTTARTSSSAAAREAERGARGAQLDQLAADRARSRRRSLRGSASEVSAKKTSSSEAVCSASSCSGAPRRERQVADLRRASGPRRAGARRPSARTPAPRAPARGAAGPARGERDQHAAARR